MQHIVAQHYFGPGAVLEVNADRQVNLRFLDSLNYSQYKSGRSYRGAAARLVKSPARIAPPHAGNWFVVLEPGAGTIRYGLRVLN